MSDTNFASPTVDRSGHVSYGDDKGLYVEFYLESVYQEFLSKKEGRQIYSDVPYIRILQPGGKSEINRPVRMEPDGRGAPPDPERFPGQWVSFQNKQVQVQTGTPLEQWPILKKSQVEEFKAQRVYTVEQLAQLPDTVLHNFGMGGRGMRDQAIVFMNKAEEGKALSAANSRIEQLENQIEALTNQMKNLSDAKPADEAVKRGPGRPRKEQANADSSQTNG